MRFWPAHWFSLAGITNVNRYIIPLIIVIIGYDHNLKKSQCLNIFKVYNFLVSKYPSPTIILSSTETTLISTKMFTCKMTEKRVKTGAGYGWKFLSSTLPQD